MSERTTDEEKERFQQLMRLTADGQVPVEHAGLWWLSFANDDGCRGVCMIEGASFIDAVTVSHRLGCNPGGQVVGVPIPAEGARKVAAHWKNRALTLAEMRAFDKEMLEKEPSV